MKRGTPEHPKMMDLAESIHGYLTGHGIPLPLDACETLACGLMEKMWHYAAKYAPAGNIGKHSDARIARAIGWAWDANWLIETLCDDHGDNGAFLNRSDICRLFVHDWWEHCEDNIHIAIARKREVFADGRLPRMTRLERKERDQIIADYRRIYGDNAYNNGCIEHKDSEDTQDNREDSEKRFEYAQQTLLERSENTRQAKAKPRPSQAFPSQATAGPRPIHSPIGSPSPKEVLETPEKSPDTSDPEPDAFDLADLDWDRVEHDARKIADRVRPQNASHVKFFVRLAAACQRGLSEGFIPDTLSAMKVNPSRAGPQAHFTSIAKSKAAEEFQIDDLFLFLRRYRKVDNGVVTAIKTAFKVP